MLKDKIYPQYGNAVSGVKMTDTIENMAGTVYAENNCPEDIAEPYYMGYIEPEMYPDSYNLFEPDIEPGENPNDPDRDPIEKLSFKPVKNQNYSWLFGCQFEDTTTTVKDMAPNLYRRLPTSNGYKWESNFPGYTDSRRTRFINDIQISKYCWAGKFSLWCEFHTLNGLKTCDNYNYNRIQITLENSNSTLISFKDFQDFMAGRIKFKAYRYSGSTQYTCVFGIEDWDEDEKVFKKPAPEFSPTWEHVVMPMYISDNPRVLYEGMWGYIRPTINPMFKVECYDNDGADTSILLNANQRLDRGTLNFALTMGSYKLHWYGNGQYITSNYQYNAPFKNAYLTGIRNTINFDEVIKYHDVSGGAWNSNNNFYNNGRIFSATGFGYTPAGDGTQEYCRYLTVTHSIDIHDLYFYLSFMNRINSDVENLSTSWTTTTEYNKDEQTPKYTEIDIPTLEFLKGEYDVIEPDLRPWQKQDASITENDYDEAEKPEAEEPGEPKEDEPDKIGEGPDWDGDKAQVRNFASQMAILPDNMFTLYGFNPAQMAKFGNKLWAGFGSEDFMNNFWTAVFNTATIDFSEVLKYFPVCRLYHIDFSNAYYTSTYSKTGPNLYFARGTGPLFLENEEFIKFKSPITMVGSCSVTIPEAKDWQDLEPYASAQIYIPYCGIYDIPVNDIVGQEIYCVGHLNLLTGELMVHICRGGVSGNILMTVQGQMGVDIPLSTDNVSSKIATLTASLAIPAVTAGAVGSAMSIGKGFAGMGKLAASGQLADRTARRGIDMGVDVGSLARGAQKAGDTIGNAASSLSPNMTGGVTNVSSPTIKGMLGITGPSRVYVFIKRTNTVKSGLHSSTNGNPLKHSKRIRECSGWTVCTNPKLTGITATAEELEQIRSLLSTGIYA